MQDKVVLRQNMTSYLRKKEVIRWIPQRELCAFVVAVARRLNLGWDPIVGLSLTWDGTSFGFLLTNREYLMFKLKPRGDELYLPLTREVLEEMIYTLTLGSGKLINSEIQNG